MASDVEEYSTSAASNTGEFPENQAPSTLNNGARSVQAHVALWKERIDGAIVAGGTANAITGTTTAGFASHTDGRTVVIEAAFDNTSTTPTFNLDGIGAVTITKLGGLALDYGNIRDGQYIILKYNDGAAKWELLNPAEPAGRIITEMTSTVPAGMLECDGSAISRTTYAALFAKVGTLYGVGNGTTTFNIPDLRGEFLRGYDNTAGNDPDAASRTDSGGGTTGDNVGTKQGYATEDHQHDYVAASSNWEGGPNTGLIYNQSGATKATTGGPGDNETRPRNVGVMFCITY